MQREEPSLFQHPNSWLTPPGVEVERVMTDNGSGYRSSLFNDWLEAAGIERKHARPYSPWQNGKVERMNRTLAQERGILKTLSEMMTFSIRSRA